MPSAIQIRCPFCLNQHPVSDSLKCPETGRLIPPRYMKDVAKGVRIANMLTIGFSGHGKTCYLAALIYSLRYGEPIRNWPGFSFLGLDDDTLDIVLDQYVRQLILGVLPEATREFVPYTLILRLSRMPLATKAGSLTVSYSPKDLVLNLYDARGEAFQHKETIARDIALLGQLNNLVLLFDLSRVRTEAATTGKGPEEQLHDLLSRVLAAVDELGQDRKKGVVICFTKADELWGNDDYGPLSIRPTMHLQAASGMTKYVSYLDARSDSIAEWVLERYPSVYYLLHEYFKPVRFASVSALGTSPGSDGRTVDSVVPSGIMDPLLSLLRMDGLL